MLVKLYDKISSGLNLKIIKLRTFSFLCLTALMIIGCTEQSTQKQNQLNDVNEQDRNVQNRNSQAIQIEQELDTLKKNVSNDLSLPDSLITSSSPEDLSLFSGQAEIAIYKLNKARYKGIHPGEAVLIFVTEPFLTDKQVKADQPDDKKSQKVLKLNRIDRFKTGIYDYSQYTSVFTPIDNEKAKYPLKITMGSQDWCGQSFTQINKKKAYAYRHFSYFENEGDTAFRIPHVYTGDNMMNLARISPDLLPQGDFQILPAFNYLRSAQVSAKSYYANASIEETDEGYLYVYNIPELKRTVRYYISSKNQYQITQWEEHYPTVLNNEMHQSVYTLEKVKYIPYWKHNNAEDIHLREELQLDF
ncbi:hypothetical protein CW751_03670 [Brumimicrobium salinarum]|uniref:Septum formation inhibitor Maf n=1 Tax=Brumimicrobium salinarum TaxID=2058658 RepID=A0A2I0R4W9_9FLAO|nr:hypothetical protein [Brumimicrobium salinarum]PKR81634.1 hypothetical protein CW751_03670 [Brumimicrobium salinarum]